MPSRLPRSRWLPFLLLVLFGLWLLWPGPATMPDAAAPVPANAPRGGPLPSATSPAVPAPRPGTDSRQHDALPAFLPKEARDTISLIQRGGPFPYRQDGVVFRNREGHLPRRQHGYYREYTVETPGLDHRGARRIVTGGDPPEAWYYTDDHYDSFRQFSPGATYPQGAAQ